MFINLTTVLKNMVFTKNFVKDLYTYNDILFK